jgi:hypothetical protein
MAVPFGKHSFTVGEISPAMLGRQDTDRYAAACSTARNFLISYAGPLLSRAGTAFVGFSKQTGRNVPPRLIDFQFSNNQGLALEFGNYYMRAISNGAYVTETPSSIVGITKANPAVVTIAAASVASATANNGSVSASYKAGDTITLAGGTSTSPGVLTVGTTQLASLAINSPGVTTLAIYYQGYAPGDTITLACAGTFSTAAMLTVGTTKVVSAILYLGAQQGSGGTPGTATVTGTSGTGTKFTANVTIGAGGNMTAVNSFTGGAYTANPSALYGNRFIVPVTGGGLSGAYLIVGMGIASVSILDTGSFTANAFGGAFTQSSTSGNGSGATFNSALFGPNALTVSTPGNYSVFPTSPASQASTSGSGAGATFTLGEQSISYNTGGWLYLSGIGGMGLLNGETFVATQLTSTTYSLQDVYGNNIDSTAFGAYTSGGSAARIYTLPTVYSENDLAWLKTVQSADAMSICCVNQLTSIEYPPQDLVRTTDINWAFLPVIPDPTVGPPASIGVIASATGAVSYAYVVTAVAPDGTESIASPIASISSAVDIASTAGSLTVNWAGVAGVNEYYVYKAIAAYGGATVPAGSLFGYAGQAYGNQLVDSNIVPDFTQVPPTHANPFAPGQLLDVQMGVIGVGYLQATVGYTISSATGSGAVLQPIVVNGAIVACLILDPGKNYQPGDTIAFSSQGSGSGAAATAVATPKDTTDGGSLGPVTVSNGGANYVNPTATVPPSFGVQATFFPPVLGPGGVITAIYVNKPGTLYAATQTLTITDSVPAGSGATATLNIGPQTGVNPSVPAYFQERRGYANSLNNPDTYWFSQPGAFTNFDVRNPTIASDAISGSPWAVQVNGVQWMIQTSGGLMVMTGLRAWMLVGAGSFATNVQPISPSQQNDVPQSFSGVSALIEPLLVNYDVLYADPNSVYYYDLPYQLYALSEPLDLTDVSAHLFDGYTVVANAYCEKPYRLIWSVRSDGALLSLTYYKTQKVQGWTRHDTLGLFVGVCAVTEPPVNAAYFATQRFINGNNAYMIERMDNRLWSDVESTWCVDCGLAYGQPAPAATLTLSSATGLGALTGATGIVGGLGYSSAAYGTVVDQFQGPGSGAVPTLTFAGGALTGVTFAGGSQGSGYTQPKLVLYDPAGSAGGSGASAALTLNNAATLNASAAVFSAGSVGSFVRAGGGIAVITAYVSTTQVTANVLTPFPTIPNTSLPVSFAAGDWTMTTPTSTLSGLRHLAGATVTGLADGNVIPPTVVSASGTITLSTPASAITVGLGFQAQFQDVPIDLGNPTQQAQRKKIAAASVRLSASRGVKVGANQQDGSTLSPTQVSTVWNNMQTAPDAGPGAPNFPPAPYNALATPLRTGDVRVPLMDGMDTTGQVCVQQDNPLPCNIVAIYSEILSGDTPSMQAAPKQQRGQR